MPPETTGYSIQVKLDLPFEQAIAKVTAALKEEGFGVLTEIDVKATLKAKLDVDFRRYVILGACNPPLAYRAFVTQLDIGVLLPCNIIVYEEDGASVVAVQDPVAMLGLVKNPKLEPVAEEARVRLQRMAESLVD